MDSLDNNKNRSSCYLMKTFFTIFLGFIGGIIGGFTCFALIVVAFEPILEFFGG